MGNLTCALSQRSVLRWDDGGLHFWVGPMETTTAAPCPTCWDELLDWTEEASKIFQHYLRIRIAGKGRTRIECADLLDTEVQFFSRILKSGGDPIRNLPSMKYLDLIKSLTENVSKWFSVYLRIRMAGKETTTYPRMEVADHESDTELHFIPHVLKSSGDQIRNLPSMEYFDRIKYLAENVSNWF
jgi:hypothetical protein